MEHIKLLSQYLNLALNTAEKELLIDMLSSTDNLISNGGVIQSPVISLEQDKEIPKKEVESCIKETFYSLSRRKIKYSVIKKRLMIQRPKKINKLENAIKQIGEGEGGFSDLIVKQIVENLIHDKVLDINASNELVWLK